MLFDHASGVHEEEFDGGFVDTPHVGVVFESFFLGESERTARSIDVRADSPDSGAGEGRACVLAAEEILVVDVVAVMGSGAKNFDGASRVVELALDGLDELRPFFCFGLGFLARGHFTVLQLIEN